MQIVFAHTTSKEFRTNGLITNKTGLAALANPNVLILWQNPRPGCKIFFSCYSATSMVKVFTEETAPETLLPNHIMAGCASIVKGIFLVNMESGIVT